MLQYAGKLNAIGLCCINRNIKVNALCNGVVFRFYCNQQRTPSPWDKLKFYFQTNYPEFSKYCRFLINGHKQCYRDLKTYYRTKKELESGEKSLVHLTRHELEVLLLSPTDIEKLLIIGFILFLPMPMFLLAFAVCWIFYPRLMMIRQIWTGQQTKLFTGQMLAYRHRQYYAAAVKLYFDTLVKAGRTTSGTDLMKALSSSAAGMSFEEQLQNQHLFTDPSVQIDKLGRGHQVLLSRIHGMLPLLNTASRLKQRSEIIQALDNKLRREDLSSLSRLDLYTSLYARQINTAFMDDNQRIAVLESWLNFTIEPKPASWLLHAPVFAQCSLKSYV